MKRIMTLCFIFFLIPLFAADPPPAVFDDLTAACSISYGPDVEGWWYYRYNYLLANPSTNTLDVFGYSIPLSSSDDDVIFPQAEVDTPRARNYYENYCMISLHEAWGTPTGSNMIPREPFISIDRPVSVGRSETNPCVIKSFKPPSLTQIWVSPRLDIYLGQVATSRGVQEYEYFDSSDIEFEYLRKIYSLGPSPFRIGTFQHWDKLIADVSKSKEIGWVYDNDLYGVIYQKLTIARQSAYDGDLTTVNQKLADIIQAIQNSTQAQRKDEFYYLVYYNADSLKENLPWPCEPKMTATPDYGKHALGELHQIEATLFNQANGQPIDNELLTMEVLEGPHLGTIQEVLTDAQGKATLGYIGYAEGIDEIQIRTKQGTFAGKKDKNGQTGRPSGVETPMIKKTSEAKQTDAGGKDGAKLTKKQRKSLESDCSAWDVYSGKLFAEWEGYIDLATMLAPKASQVKPNDMLFLAATVYNFGSVASPTTNLRFYMASDPFLPDNYPDGISLGDLSVDALEPGTSFSCMQPVSIPSSVGEGTYYFEACVDPDGQIVQSAYWNDCASATASLILALPGVVPLNHPPDCSGAVASVAKLWPPNHKLAGISIQGVTDPDGDAVTLSVTSITQDEPVNGLGDGDTSPDGFGVGTANPQVRAERSGTGNGRVYRINFKGTDAKGAECTGSVAVGVPHDKKDTPVDDGQNYDSTLQ